MVVTPGRRSWGRLLRRARPLSPQQAAREGGWLVLAPHPDDETLGCGGLIAALAACGGAVTVAILTDGSGSHVGAPGWSASRVAHVRAREAGAALRQLGHSAQAVTLGWRDAAPLPAGSPPFEASVDRLVALCRARRIRRIIASWEGDPHCDHEAAAQLATAVARRLGVVPRFYCVWGWTVADLDHRLAGWKALSIPVARWRGRQRRALDRHATQLGGRIAGAPDRFVLPRPMRRLVDASHLLLLEPRHAP
ncbi:PIG-L family deacetylase [Sphingomonas sp. KR1UV-12]|uniref:PIG-L family deacetylase n=1 Tax=Sphingomonas aurea TaxID=3063994 RepID=A0ABT9EG13_9SPHN|nr:PIG-L family deacetylase [Sphingomonas sp. KR1UV-12]MDP1025908.1 PIG-L family deacetylase [Sphingomonas sp. KR1UV-12]